MIYVVWKDFLLTAVIKRGSLLVIDEEKTYENFCKMFKLVYYKINICTQKNSHSTNGWLQFHVLKKMSVQDKSKYFLQCYD